MPNISVPVDGRMQFPTATVMVANASLNRPLLSGVDPVGYGSGMYMLKGSWPTPKASPTTNSGFSGLAASQAAAAEPKQSSAAARSVWPNLR